MKNKKEMIQLIKGVFAIDTNTEAETKFNELETALRNELVVEGGFKFAGLTVEQVEKKASSGVSKLGGEEKVWSKPAHMGVKVKVSKEAKDSVYREL